MSISEKELDYLRNRYATEQAEGITKKQMISFLRDGMTDEQISMMTELPIEKVKYLKRRWDLVERQITRSVEAYKRLSEDFDGEYLDKQICLLWGISESSLYRQKKKWEAAGEL